MRKLIIFPLMLLLTLSCSRRVYQTSAYQQLSNQHQLLAIVPVSTVTTGRIPAKWTEEELRQVEEAESKALQIALYEQIARRGGVYYGDIRVNIQHYSETNNKLKAAGISLRDSWEIPSSELAQLLGVDAVVRSSVHKQRYLSDIEGLAVGVASTILNSITGNPVDIYGASRTSEVWATAAVVDAESGVAVWTTRRKCPTYWNRPHQEVVDRIAATLARRFPYRLGE